MLQLAEPAATVSNPPRALFSHFRWKTKSALEDKRGQRKVARMTIGRDKSKYRERDSEKGIRWRHKRRGSNL